MNGNEAVAEPIDFPHGAVDWVVIEDRGISQVRIAGLQRMHRLLYGFLDQSGLIAYLLADKV